MDKADHNETRDVARDTARATAGVENRYEELTDVRDEAYELSMGHSWDSREALSAHSDHISDTEGTMRSLKKLGDAKGLYKNPYLNNPDLIEMIEAHLPEARKKLNQNTYARGS